MFQVTQPKSSYPLIDCSKLTCFYAMDKQGRSSCSFVLHLYATNAMSIFMSSVLSSKLTNFDLITVHLQITIETRSKYRRKWCVFIDRKL
jgi:hypothetical protein